MLQRKMKGSGHSLQKKNDGCAQQPPPVGVGAPSSATAKVGQRGQKRTRSVVAAASALTHSDGDGDAATPAKRVAVDINGVGVPSPKLPEGQGANADLSNALARDASAVTADTDHDSDEVMLLKQRVAELERSIPKTPLEYKLADEVKQMKAKIAEEAANREARRRKTPAARVPIPPNLHPYLRPLCIDKAPKGPLFVSTRRALDGDEKAPDSDTMLKTLRKAAKTAGLQDWVRILVGCTTQLLFSVS